MSRAHLSISQAIALGTLAAGTIDALDAVIFFGLRGAAPMRIFQGIAAGAIGRDVARAGGWSTATFGLFIHYLVAFGIAATYILASRPFPVLAQRPFVYGPIFGIGAYLFMTLVVIPLSRIGPQPFTTGPLVNGILIHAFGIAIPVALIARRASAFA